MHARDLPVGTKVDALATNWYGVYEVTAEVVADYMGAPAFVFAIPMVRGKNGKEPYSVTGFAREEGAGFCVL